MLSSEEMEKKNLIFMKSKKVNPDENKTVQNTDETF